MRTAGVLPVEECRIVRTAKNEAHAWGNLSIEGKAPEFISIIYSNVGHTHTYQAIDPTMFTQTNRTFAIPTRKFL